MHCVCLHWWIIYTANGEWLQDSPCVFQNWKLIPSCKFLGFCSSAVYVSVFLGCGVAWPGDWWLKFWDSIVVSSSAVECSCFMDIAALAGEMQWPLMQRHIKERRPLCSFFLIALYIIWSILWYLGCLYGLLCLC